MTITAYESSQKVGHTRGAHADFEVGNPLFDSLQFGLIDLVCEEFGFVCNEVVKTGPDARNRIAVIVDHPESEADGQKETGKMVEMEKVSAAS